MSLFLLLTGMPAAPSQSTGAKCFIHSFAASLHMSVRQWLRWLLTLPAAIAAVTLLHYHADHILSTTSCCCSPAALVASILAAALVAYSLAKGHGGQDRPDEPNMHSKGQLQRKSSTRDTALCNLKDQLEQGLQGAVKAAARTGTCKIDAGTPADKLLVILYQLADGHMPGAEDIRELQNVLLNAQDIYQVGGDNLAQRLAAADVDQDVGDALMAQLARNSAYYTPRPNGTVDGGSPTHSRSRAQLGDAEGDALDCGYMIEEDSLHDVLLHVMRTTSRESSWSIESSGAFAEQQQCRPSGDTSPQASSAEIRAASPVGLPLDEVEQLLGEAWSSWWFDSFRLHDLTCGHPMSTLGFYLIHRAGLIWQLDLDARTLARFLVRLEAGYGDPRAVPYHGKPHAAQVLQSMHMLLSTSGLMDGSYVDPLTHLACLLAAACHDHGHMGRTNNFLVATRHPLALRYNDRAPLENHHVASTFELLHGCSGINFLADMPRPDYQRLRKLMIELVLATDMRSHFAILSQFNTRMGLQARVNGGESPLPPVLSRISRDSHCLGLPPLHPNARNSNIDITGSIAAPALGSKDNGHSTTAGPPLKSSRTSWSGVRGSSRDGRPSSGGAGGGGSQCRGGNQAGGLGRASRFEGPPGVTSTVSTILSKGLTEDQDRSVALQVMIKAADVSHLGLTFDLHYRWLQALEEEFFRQGDAEAALGLPVSPLFDRAKPGCSKSQSLSCAFPATGPLLSGVMANYCHRQGAEAAAKEMPQQ